MERFTKLIHKCFLRKKQALGVAFRDKFDKFLYKTVKAILQVTMNSTSFSFDSSRQLVPERCHNMQSSLRSRIMYEKHDRQDKIMHDQESCMRSMINKIMHDQVSCMRSMTSKIMHDQASRTIICFC